jgi:hypothetical protein
VKGLSTPPFLAINAKGGENIKPKAKGPHHQFQKKDRTTNFKTFRNEDLFVFHNYLFLNWYHK